MLIQVLEASWLGVLAAASFSPFYSNLFQIIIQSGPYSTSLSFALLAFILTPAIVAAASLHPLARGLRACWGGLAILLKLFPYLFFVPLFNYSLGSALQGDSLPARIVSLVNVTLLLAYLFFHEFLN